MKKTIHVSLIYILILTASSLCASNLDRLLHPLLKKGQWLISPSLKGYGQEYFTIIIGAGEYTNLVSYGFPCPKFSFGVTENLQLTVDSLLLFPSDELSYPQFFDWEYQKEKMQLYFVSGQLTYRPKDNYELNASLLWGGEKKTTDLATSYYTTEKMVERHKNYIFKLNGTWISNPKHDDRLIKADLDGLHHPLLKKGQWKISPEIQAMSYECSSDNRESENQNESETIYSSQDDLEVKDFRLRMDASYGINDKFQAEADVYWYFPFEMPYQYRSSFTNPENGSVERFFRNEKKEFKDNFGARIKFIYRFNPQFELFIEPRHSQYKTILSEEYKISNSGGIESTSDDKLKSFSARWQMKIGGTWVSRSKKPGFPFKSNLSSVIHPLLGKKQIKFDGFIYYESVQDWWDYHLWHGDIMLTYGISNSFQIAVSRGWDFYKNAPTHSFFHSKYEKDYTGGIELRYRRKDKFEVYFKSDYHPNADIHRFPPFLYTYFETNHHDFIDLLTLDFHETINLRFGIDWIL